MNSALMVVAAVVAGALGAVVRYGVDPRRSRGAARRA